MIHPDRFKGSALGLLIRGVNFMRWKLETAVQRLVLRWMLKHHAVDAARAEQLKRGFELDVAAERLEMTQTSPLRLEEQRMAGARAERYAGGAGPVAVMEQAMRDEMQLPARPVSPQNLIAAFGGAQRTARYVKGQRRTLQADESNFEAVDE
jgi:hypothetical protein